MRTKQLLVAFVLSTTLFFLPSIKLYTQDEGKGIKWTTGLSWEQIKQKAKAENKYIFLDCYATWCGPCKLMDKNVYTADSVGEFFNEKFISIKVQMDKTANDNNEVRKWYSDADSFNAKYHIEGFPTLIFFNSNGQVTQKLLGYVSVDDFLAFGKSATIPGKIYDDPRADYYKKIAAYKAGERNYDFYPLMIRGASDLQDTALSKQLAKEFTEYAVKLTPKERYTKERIEFWNDFLWTSNTKVFDFFFNDGHLINKVMGNPNYSEDFIDKTLQYEIVLPFLKDQAKGAGISLEGAYLTYVGKGAAPNADYSQADWKQLDKLIRLKYGKDYAKRNVLKARMEWYTRHQNKNALVEYALKLFNSYPPDLKNRDRFYYDMNKYAWEAFLRSTNKNILKGYAKWMEKVVQYSPKRDAAIDTYANLLYKLGHKRKAIEWEEKAAKLYPVYEEYSKRVELMKKGMPTCLDQGAVWKN